MLYQLLQTQESYLVFFIRIVTGIILFPHGFQKLAGWFGGDGFKGTLEHMGHLGIPKFIAVLVITGQAFGSLALIIGLLGHIVAFFVFIIMAGAMIPNIKNGWLMNWQGKKAGEGIEYFVLFLSLTLIIILKGSGAYSLDYWLFK